MSRGATTMSSGERTASIWRFTPIVLIGFLLIAGYAAGFQHYLSLRYLADSRDALNGYVDAHPISSAIGFLILYAVAIGCAFPAASVLTIFSGFLFGWLLGGLIALVGATLGATALYLAARTALGDALSRRVDGFIARLATGFRKDAFGYLLALRLAPFVPFVAVNISAAVFGVKPRTFVAATFVGIIPAVFAYAWLGEGVGSVLVAAREAGHELSVRDLATPQISIAFTLLALVAVVAAIVKRRWARRLG